jgi:hypothetical protein
MWLQTGEQQSDDAEAYPDAECRVAAKPKAVPAYRSIVLHDGAG